MGLGDQSKIMRPTKAGLVSGNDEYNQPSTGLRFRLVCCLSNRPYTVQQDDIEKGRRKD